MPGGERKWRGACADQVIEDGETAIRRRRANGISCPHCASPTRARTTRLVLPTVREIYLQCTNIRCGATFGARLELTHQIVASACPNPDVFLRKTAPRYAAVAPVPIGGREVPRPANDEEVGLAG